LLDDYSRDFQVASIVYRVAAVEIDDLLVLVFPVGLAFELVVDVVAAMRIRTRSSTKFRLIS
jgi:hypothetical protein